MRGVPPPGPLRTLALATLANTVGTGLWLAGGALYLTRDVGLSATSVGAGLTVAGLVGLTASVPLGGLADRWDPRTLRAALQVGQALAAAVRLSRGADTAAPAAAKLRRAGLVLAAACPLYAVTAGLPVLPAVALLLVATAVWTVGDLWHGAAGAGLAYDLAPPGAIGAYQGADGLLAGLAQALGRGLLTLLVLGGGGTGWLVLGGLFAVVGLAAPALARRAVASQPAPVPVARPAGVAAGTPPVGDV
ncbi:hypothetical protein AB0H28_22195 [Micromonospora sp. NPDC050980]|uniref:hypothetical protein n=1 Tax=Micromonospora sp. NPDC050980 TaxID=3155161 RepID=UPI0033E871A0